MIGMSRGIAKWTTVALVCAAMISCKKGAGPAAGGPLSYVPADSAFVVGISVKQLMQAPLWKKFEAVAKKEMDKATQECGFDPYASVDNVLVAGPMNMAEQKFLLVVQGSLPQDKAEACLQKMAEKEGKKITVKKEGNITTYEGSTPEETLHAYWPGGGSIVIAKDKAVLAQVAAGVKDAAKNLQPLLAETDPKATVWGAMLIPAEGPGSTMFSDFEGGKPVSGYMHLSLTKSLNAKLGLRFAKEEEAKSATDKVLLVGTIDFGAFVLRVTNRYPPVRLLHEGAGLVDLSPDIFSMQRTSPPTVILLGHDK